MALISLVVALGSLGYNATGAMSSPKRIAASARWPEVLKNLGELQVISGMDEEDILDLLEWAVSSIMIHLHAREEVGVIDHDAIFIHGKFGLEAAAIKVLE